MYLHAWIFRWSHSGYKFLWLKGYRVKFLNILRDFGTFWKSVVVFAFYNHSFLSLLACCVWLGLAFHPSSWFVLHQEQGTRCVHLHSAHQPLHQPHTQLDWSCDENMAYTEHAEYLSVLEVRWLQMCQINQGQLFIKLNTMLGRCFIDKVSHMIIFSLVCRVNVMLISCKTDEIRHIWR